MSTEQQQQLVIIMLGGHNIVQSKPMRASSAKYLLKLIAEGQHTNRSDNGKLLAVPTRGGTEYVVIPNIATVRLDDVDTDEDDDGTLLVDRVSGRPPLS